MSLRLRNTLTRRIDPVEPLEPGRVGMYTCGPTVYRYAHVGNLRSNLLADLIRRTLLYHGIEVLHVKNITDVGHLRDEGFDRGADPMLVAAGLEHKTPGEIADAYEAAFHADEAAVNILPAHVFPRATEHIPEMVALAEALQDAGYAYETTEGNVYYEVGRFEGYGRLSGNTLADLRAGHRGDIEPDKRDPADFALWKAAGDGRILKWPTGRWGEGYPGWHLECSAMAMRYLGPQFDIHTGGIDNVFPHHEDEIAQSTPISGEVPARHWVHGEFLLMAGKKMAKSAGNFQRVTELVERGLDPLAFRYLVLTSHYSRKLEYSDRSLDAGAAALGSLRAGIRALGAPPAEGPWAAPPVLIAGAAGDRPIGLATGPSGHGGAQDPTAFALTDRADAPAAPLSEAGRTLHARFVAAIDDDLDMPVALALLREILRAPLSADERRWLVLDADLVLGLDLDRVWRAGSADGPAAIPTDIQALADERAAARTARDWPRADALRAELDGLGWDVIDTPDGARLHRRGGTTAG
jgi:cysteinyl-tRNA synthetase